VNGKFGLMFEEGVLEKGIELSVTVPKPWVGEGAVLLAQAEPGRCQLLVRRDTHLSCQCGMTSRKRISSRGLHVTSCKLVPIAKFMLHVRLSSKSESIDVSARQWVTGQTATTQKLSRP
jgi:hypothetical protein